MLVVAYVHNNFSCICVLVTVKLT